MHRLSEIQTPNQLNDLIEALSSTSELAWEDLLTDLSQPRLASKIKSLVTREYGTSKSLETLDQLDRVLSKATIGLPGELSDIQLGHLMFFMPTHLQHYRRYYKQYFAQMGSFSSTIGVYHQSNAECLLDVLESEANLHFSPCLALQLAFRVSTIPRIDERRVLPRIRDQIRQASGTAVVKTMISKRLSNLLKESPGASLPEVPRVALLISGQMRETVPSLQRVKSYFKLDEYDVYVSTWKKPGSTPLEQGRLRRRVQEEGVKYINKSVTDEELAKMRDLDTETFDQNSMNLEDVIRENLIDSNELFVNITDEDQPPFLGKSNHWKMHFHNRYWPSKLGHDYFNENYDLIIKIRPDIIFTGFDRLSPSQISDPGLNVLNDHPDWLYETWGLGMGDQLFIGRTERMLNILDISFPRSLSTRMQTVVFDRRNLVQGHISVGTELWLQGGKPCPLPITKKGLASDTKLALSEILTLHEKAKERLS